MAMERQRSWTIEISGSWRIKSGTATATSKQEPLTGPHGARSRTPAPPAGLIRIREPSVLCHAPGAGSIWLSRARLAGPRSTRPASLRALRRAHRRVGWVKSQVVPPAAQFQQRPAHPLDGGGRLPAAPACEVLRGPDRISHEGVKESLLIRLASVRLARSNDFGIRQLAVDNTDARADVQDWLSSVGASEWTPPPASPARRPPNRPGPRRSRPYDRTPPPPHHRAAPPPGRRSRCRGPRPTTHAMRRY